MKNRLVRGFFLLFLLSVVVLGMSACGKEQSSGKSESKDGSQSMDVVIPCEGTGGVLGESTADTETAKTESETETKTPDVPPAVKQGVTICVDPGHGFDDGGCSSALIGDTLERDWTLKYSLALKDALENSGYTVVMTHDGVVFPKTAEDNDNNKYSPQERVSYANSLAIDYYISLHCDSFEEDASVGGTRVYYCNSSVKTTGNSGDIAQAIWGVLCDVLPDERAPRLMEMPESDAYYVLKSTKAPASLVEIGFITNQTDADKIQSSTWQDTFIRGVVGGIEAYFAEQK